MVKRYLLVEVNVGLEGDEDLPDSSPSVSDWGAYKRFLQDILKTESRYWNVSVHAVYDLALSGTILHERNMGPQGKHVPRKTEE